MAQGTQKIETERECDPLHGALLGSRLFAGVPPDLVSVAVAGSETRALAPQELLLAAGADNDVLFIVLSGLLSVRVPGTDHPHIRLGVGECVGELSFLDGQQVSADVMAVEPSVVLAIDRERLWPLIESSGDVARNLLRLLAGRVRSDDAAMADSDRQKRHLESLATVDGLTGLRNRRWMDDAFSREVVRAERTGKPLSVLLIDIDHFKRLNDAHGHPVGDSVLRRVGQALAKGLRPVDLIARYGGEEFSVLMPGLGPDTAVAVAERLRLAVEADEGDGCPRTTVSVGVASLGSNESLAVLVARADKALYRAKAAGRNRTSTWS